MGGLLRKAFIASTALLFEGVPLTALADDYLQSNRFIAQYAGNSGLFSVGVERRLGEHGGAALLLGYAPESEVGIDILALGLKSHYRFAPLISNEKATVGLYGGIGLFYYIGEQYSTRDYPSGYYTYPSSSWHLMPYLGVRLTGNEPAHRGITIYGEVGVLDAYLIHYYNNRGYLRPGDVINLALGMSLPLGR